MRSVYSSDFVKYSNSVSKAMTDTEDSFSTSNSGLVYPETEVG
jgi:hypothetical protein